MLGPRAFASGLTLPLALTGLLFSGCAGPCAQVRAARQDFDARRGPAPSADLAMWLPYARIDALIAPQIKALPRMPVPLPELMGMQLSSMEAMVESVRVRPAAAGKVGFRVRVSLRAKHKRLLVVELSAAAAPRIDRAAGTVNIDLSQASIDEIEAKIDRSGTRALSDWLWSQMPTALQSVTPRGALNDLVAGLASELSTGLGAQFKDELPALFRDVAALEFELGGLPLAKVEVRSDADALQLALTSDLPVKRGLSKPFARAQSAKDIELRMSGEALAAYVNYAMRAPAGAELFDEIPSRFDERGEADPQGLFQARAEWVRGPRPLKLEVFSQDKDCAHVRLGATPTVTLAGGGRLEVKTQDARLEKVHSGGVRVRAAIFFGGLGRRSFALAQSIATDADFEVGGQDLRAQVHAAALDGEGLRLGLRLAAVVP